MPSDDAPFEATDRGDAYEDPDCVASLLFTGICTSEKSCDCLQLCIRGGSMIFDVVAFEGSCISGAVMDAVPVS